VELLPVESTALEAVAYDEGRRVLAVRYRGGGTYEYLDVSPELFRELLDHQPHPWSVVGERVKEHDFRQLE
jgi:hypothetical protein